MKSEITAYYPADEIRIIPNSVDLALYRPSPDREALRLQLGLAQYERLVVYAGRFSEEKGVDFLLRAFSVLQPGKIIRLWLFGEGPKRASLDRLINELRIQTTVRLHDTTENIIVILQAADLFIMPSKFEGMSNAVLEAMACGVPVIATDVPGNRDIIEHNSTGLLVPFGDTTALSSAITSVLDNSELAGLLSENARKKVASQYNVENAVAQHRQLYADLAACDSGRETPA